MNLELVAIAIFVYVGHNVVECSASCNRSGITQGSNSCDKFDAIFEQLVAHSWSKDERPCSEQLLKTITNVKNSTLWATWIWDSIQLPVGLLYGSKYHLGNYDQCLRETVGSSQPPFRTQYCLADVVLGTRNQSNYYPEEINPYASTEDYISTKTKLKQSFNKITWGVCVPESCQTESVKTFLRALLKQSHLGHLQTPLNITVTHCEPAGETKKHIDGFHIVLLAAVLISVMGLYCTKYVTKHQNTNSDSFATNVKKCFCLKRNTNEWLQRQKNDVQVLHGIRYFSSCLIILLHKIVLTFTVSMGNGLDFEEGYYSYRHLINSLPLVVDNFFVISGLLHVKNTKPFSTPSDLMMMLVKRYFRLIWWYILSTLLISFIIPRSGCGPLCASFMAPEYEHCAKGWWSGFFMLGNYIHDNHICNPVVWYTFSDFQLTVVATVLLWLHQRNPRAAVICFSTLAVLSILLPASVVYKSPEIITFEIDFELYRTIKNGTMTPAVALYQRTHHRAMPYLVGMVMGYIMSNCRAEIFEKTFTKKQFASLLSITPVWMCLWWLSNENFKAAMLLVTVRVVWAGANCALIAAAEYGYTPCLKKFFSLSIFVPLSKLTYGAYMIHCMTISYTWCSARSPHYASRHVLAEQYLGNLVLTNIFSLFVLLFIETPLNNLVKLLCRFGSKTEAKTKAADGDENKSDDAPPSYGQLMDIKDKEL